MPDAQRHGVPDAPQLERMPDEALRRLLREEFESTGKTEDPERILYISGLLAARREPGEVKPAGQAWESFLQDYAPELGKAETRRSRARKWWASAAAVLVLAAVIAGGSATARGSGNSLWDIVVKWTQETFRIGYVGEADAVPPQTYDTLDYHGLVQTLEQLHMDTALVPAWLPDGYAEADISVQENVRQRRVLANYECGENCISVRIAEHMGDSLLDIEQSKTDAEKYVSKGIDYYILNNYDQMQVAWIKQNYECLIQGPFSIGEAKKIIDSIGGK